MPDKEHPGRPWREIAEEASKEQNPERVSELVIELDKALEVEENKGKTRARASGSLRQRGSDAVDSARTASGQGQ